MADRVSLSSEENAPLFNDDNTARLNDDNGKTFGSSQRIKYSLLIWFLVFLCVLFSSSLIVILVLKAKTGIESKKIIVNQEDVLHFFQLSDTHLDMHYNESVTQYGQFCRNVPRINKTTYNVSHTKAKFGRVGCDTSIGMLEAVVTHMESVQKSLDQKPQFVILTGDQMAHAYEYFDVEKDKLLISSINTSTSIIGKGLGIPVIMALGNNDYMDDYQPPTNENSTLFHSLSQIFIPYIFPKDSITEKLNSIEKFNETFLVGGFYSVNVSDDLSVIVLTTSYLSRKAHMLNPAVKTIGMRQMKWLQSQLQLVQSTGKKAMIIGHMPVGISSYKTEGGFWTDDFTPEYVKLVIEYKECIVGQFYGHIHQSKIKVHQKNDYFPSADDKDQEISFLLTNPSITPVYGSNPAYRLFSMDKDTKEIQDYSQYYFDLLLSNAYSEPTWNLEYKFSDQYQSTLNLKSVLNLVKRLSTRENSTWLPYSYHIKALFGGVTSKDRFKEYCAARHVTISAYVKCLENYQKNGGM